MYVGQAAWEQFWVLALLQVGHLDLTSGPKIQPHFGFWQPTIFEEDESLGMNGWIFEGSMLGNWHREQEYRLVQGNQTRLLPVSMMKGEDCGGVPKLRETE